MEAIIIWILKKTGETAFGKLISDFLENFFPNVFKNKTKEIIQIYERRIEKKNEEISRLEKTKLTQEKRFKKNEKRIIGSLKRRSIATEKLIEQYPNPLNTILISYSSQHEGSGKGTKRSHFLREELARYNSKYLGGSDALIPPAFVPGSLQTQEDLKRWFERKILKGRYCKIKFLIMFDLKKSAFWGTYLPYIQKDPKHHTLGEVLNVEDVFTDEQIDRLAISDIITAGDIAWLSSSILSVEELDVILRNQRRIENELGNPSLRILSDSSIEDKLSKALSRYIEKPHKVSEAIVKEATFWLEKINGGEE